MKHWFCAECECEVGLGKHGQCEVCGSEAVDLLPDPSELSRPVSMKIAESDSAVVCS